MCDHKRLIVTKEKITSFIYHSIKKKRLKFKTKCVPLCVHKGAESLIFQRPLLNLVG